MVKHKDTHQRNGQTQRHTSKEWSNTETHIKGMVKQRHTVKEWPNTKTHSKGMATCDAGSQAVLISRQRRGVSLFCAPPPPLPLPLHLTQFPMTFIQRSQLCACRARDSTTVFYLEHVQCMVHDSLALGLSNPFLLHPSRTSCCLPADCES